jgi:magnesium-transporting ATPase (P-type)
MTWKLLGFLSILDPPRHDTARTVAKCNELGVEVKMITGDQRLIAVEVARQLGLPNTLIFDKDVFLADSKVASKYSCDKSCSDTSCLSGAPNRDSMGSCSHRYV